MAGVTSTDYVPLKHKSIKAALLYEWVCFIGENHLGTGDFSLCIEEHTFRNNDFYRVRETICNAIASMLLILDYKDRREVSTFGFTFLLQSQHKALTKC